MTDSKQHTHSAWASVLVTLQFGLLLWLALLATPALTSGQLPSACLVLMVLSALLGIWTLSHNRLGNFNIRPTPKTDGVLVTRGPYAWIRHPMYSALLLGAAALGWLAPAGMGAIVWCALAVVLWLKSSVEERALGQLHPGYLSYAKTVKRFIPGVV